MEHDEPGQGEPGPPARPDRRRSNLPFWHPRRLRGRRMRDVHAERHGFPYMVDRVSGHVFLMAALVLVLTVADGIFTVLLLDRGCEEANPIMKILLEHGTGTFLLGKYVLTAAFLPFALVMHQYRMFGTRIRVGQLLPVVVLLYVVLLAYQVGLWQATHGHTRVHLPAPRPSGGMVLAGEETGS